MSAFKITSLASGEIAPSLYARVDQSKYQSGLKTCRNFTVDKAGGISNRAGTKFIAQVKDSTKNVRLIEFQFSDTQTYVLEFGDEYMRVYKDAAQLTDLTLTITGISQAATAVVTYTGTDPTSGQEVFIDDVLGMTQVNNRNFKIANVNAGLNTFELQELDGTAINSTAYTAYSSGGTAKRVYEIVSPYDHEDLAELQFVQSADVITIVHPEYPPYDLARTADTTWTITAATFAPDIDRPTSVAATSGGGTGNRIRYRVTATKEETYEESLVGLAAAATILTASAANPVLITTSAAHNYIDGDEVLIEGVSNTVGDLINDGYFFINVTAADTFELLGVDGSALVAGATGTSKRVGATLDNVGTGSAAAPHVVTWTAVTDAIEYTVYKEKDGVFGYIGTAGSTTFNDTGITPDLTETPPIERNPFEGAGNYPSTVTYFQQRKMFANTDNAPEKVWGSQSGKFSNFTVRSPIQEDDAITFSMAGRKIKEVQHLLDLGKLVVLTVSDESAILGGDNNVLTPSTISPVTYSYHGSSSVSPILIGANAIYVQARSSIIRDLGFDFQVDGYRGNDLTIFSKHLFEGHTVVDWAFQQIPSSIIWIARDDGTLLGLTYIREQQVIGWHRHDFENGLVKDMCVIPEGEEDYLYLVIERTVNAKTVKYIERMSSRFIEEIEDVTILDSHLSYDGRNTAATTMTLSGGTDWDYEEELTLTASASYFTASEVGNEIHLENAGELIRFTITGFTSGTVVTGTVNRTVPVAMQGVALTTWSRAVDEVGGLWHLEGESVSIFADGFVEASPNNPAYDTVTVTNGVAALSRHYAVVHVGLPITSDIETLNIDTAQGETVADKNKLITKVALHVEKTRGLWAGATAPTGDDAVGGDSGLVEYKLRQAEGYDEPTEMKTEVIDVNIDGNWNSNGRIYIRQVDPVPATILAIIPIGLVPFSGGR